MGGLWHCFNHCTSTPLQFDMPSLNINIPARFRLPPILEKPLLRHNAVSILSFFQNFNGGNHGTVLCSKTRRIFSNLFCASSALLRCTIFSRTCTHLGRSVVRSSLALAHYLRCYVVRSFLAPAHTWAATL